MLQLAAILPILNRVLSNFSPTSVPGLEYLERLIGLIPVSDPLVASVLIFALVVVSRFLVTFLNELLNQQYTTDIIYDTKQKIFSKMLASRYQFFLDHKHGDLFFVSNSASERVGAYLAYFVTGVVYLLTMLSIVCFLFMVNLPVTLTISALAVVYYFMTREISIKVSYVGGKKRIELIKEQHRIVQETLNGIKYFFVFHKQHSVRDLFQKNIEAYRKQFLHDNFWQVLLQKLPEPTLLLLASFGIIVLVTAIDGQQVSSHLSVIGVFFFAIQRIVPTLNKFGTSVIQVLSGIPTLEICQKFLSEPVDQEPDGTVRLEEFKNAITLENVTLSYADGKPVLKRLNLKFAKGRMTALVGKSGSGKTSIVNLILRLYQPSDGNVEIDGINLRDLEIESFLKRVGYVGQETFLFHGSIKDNLTFFDSRFSADDVVRAAQMADAHDFIESLPEKYDTIVGDKGMKLSGGQRQRLAIARALIRKPDILILDEATSNLDSISEQVVQQTINSIAKHYTIIVVAHKLSTVMNADLIYVLADGTIVESGNHQDLIAQKGKYYQLNINSQSRVETE